MSDLIPAVESTVTALEITPDLPRRSTETSSDPLVPGATCHGMDGSLAVVHPQEVRTLLITTSLGETFVNQKVKLPVTSPVAGEISLFSASQISALGLAGGSGVTGAITACGIGMGAGGSRFGTPGGVRISVGCGAPGGSGGGGTGATWAIKA